MRESGAGCGAREGYMISVSNRASFGLNWAGVCAPALFRIRGVDFPGARAQRALASMLMKRNVGVGKLSFQAQQRAARSLPWGPGTGNNLAALGPALHRGLVAAEKVTVDRAKRRHRHKLVAICTHFALPGRPLGPHTAKPSSRCTDRARYNRE